MRRAVLAAAGLGWAGAARAAQPIVVGGTGSTLGLARHIGSAYTALNGQAFRLLPSLGSSGGLRALAAGRIDIALTLSDPGADGGSLHRVALGRTPIILATHRATAPGTLTAAKAGRLLTGDDRAWQDGGPVRLVLRPPHEREWRSLRDGPPALAAAAEGPPQRTGAAMASTAQDNAQALSGIEGSLGVISLGQIVTEALDLRVIAIDGVLPSLVSLRDGSWACVITPYAVIRADAADAVAGFARFLASREAAMVAEGLGYDAAAA